MTLVFVTRGSVPIILCQPHSGTYVPDKIRRDLNELGRELTDTDWHVPSLYEGLLEGASVIRANFSRYVIDVNRDPSGKSLYPGQNTTELVPLTTFDGQPIWSNPPDKDEIVDRIQNFHSVYHSILEKEIARIKSKFGFVVIYDCHSIRSVIPHLFDGELPDFNIGDNCGVTCAQSITNVVSQVCGRSNAYSYVVNGRFKGGWTTRHYGRPTEGVHAIQMELAQRNYLQQECPPFNYNSEQADKLRNVLKEILSSILHVIELDK